MSAQLRMRVESAHGRKCMACDQITDRWMSFSPTREAEPERYCYPCFEDALSTVRERGGVPHGDTLQHVYATVKNLDEKVVQLMAALSRAQKELQAARREADDAKAAVRAILEVKP